ncbi:uncharacterized protein LOC143174308 [Nomia melanderi]|uniref:uncharacterized protein LOC143174308 n=1 Tax=Nomia melanderi TaxID=2448451 RepID=UPI003FCE9C7D
MEKAMRRNEDDIPFGFDLEDYSTIFKHTHKSNTTKSKEKKKLVFNSPEDINMKINELLESLNHLETKTADAVTPRSKQSLLRRDIDKILQFQNEIKNLRKYNDVATMPLKIEID